MGVYILELYRDNGKEHGNYYSILGFFNSKAADNRAGLDVGNEGMKEWKGQWKLLSGNPKP